MTSFTSCSVRREIRVPIASNLLPEQGNPLDEMRFSSEVAAIVAPRRGLTVADAAIHVTTGRSTALRLATYDPEGALRVALVAFMPFQIPSPGVTLYAPMQTEIRRTVRDWLATSGREESTVHVDAVVVTPDVDRCEAVTSWYLDVMDSW